MKKIVTRMVACILILVLAISNGDLGGLLVEAQGIADLDDDDVEVNEDGDEEDADNQILISTDGIELVGEAEDNFEVINYVISQRDNSAAVATEIIIGAGAPNIELKGLNIGGGNASAITIAEGADIKLTMSEENKFAGGKGCAAIYVGEGSHLSIQNEGTLKVFGGTSGGDGIGTGADESCGKINISGGIVVAVSGDNGISIGGNPCFNDCAFVYTNDTIKPSENSDGCILYQNNEIDRNGDISKQGGSSVYGDVALDGYSEIPNGASMTVRDGSTLTVGKDAILQVAGTLKNEGKIVNRGTIYITEAGVFIQNGILTYNGSIQNDGTIYVLSSLLADAVTNGVTGRIVTPDAITITPNSGLWKYYGQERDFTNADYIASETVDTSGWSLTVSSEEIGKHNYAITITDMAGSVNGKVVLAANAPTFEIRQYTTTAAVEADSTWYNETEVDVAAPEGYLISTEKSAAGQWMDSITVSGLREGENAVYYYLRSNLNDGTNGAIDTTRKMHKVRVDTQPPVVQSLEIEEESIGDTSAKGAIKTSEAGTYYYVVLPEDADNDALVGEGGNKKLKQMVESGQGIKGSNLIDGNKDTVIDVNGLTALTEYKAYAIAKDKAGNLSAVMQSGAFTTSKVAIKGSVKLIGTASYGNTLTAVPVISTANAGELSYSWYRTKDINDESNLELIEKANSSTYKVAQEDIDAYLYVWVEGENCSGYVTGHSQLVPKLTPTYTVPKISSRIYDPSAKLNKISLPNGWEWVNASIVPTVGTKVYKAVYVPQDTERYNSVTKEITITVKAKSLSKSMVKNLKSKQYGGGTAVTSDLYLKYQNVKLKSGTDYSVSYKNNKELGKATVTIKGKKNYSGTIKVTFEIKKTDIKNLTFTDNLQVVYTEEPLYPAVTIKNGKVKLKKNSDYVVDYKSNTNIGTGKIVIKGIGSYKGTKTLNFTITPSKPTLELEKKNATSFIINYNAEYGAKNYEIVYSTAKSFPKKKTNTFTTKSNAMTIANLETKTIYYVKVRAYSKVNGKNIYGPYSKTLKVG